MAKNVKTEREFLAAAIADTKGVPIEDVSDREIKILQRRLHESQDVDAAKKAAEESLKKAIALSGRSRFAPR